MHKHSQAPDLAAETRSSDDAVAIFATDSEDDCSSFEERVLNDIRETVYQWDVKDDQLVWGRNVARVLGAETAEKLDCGRAFDALVDPESLTDRHQTVCNSIGIDYGNGVPYEVEYRLRMADGHA